MRGASAAVLLFVALAATACGKASPAAPSASASGSASSSPSASASAAARDAAPAVDPILADLWSRAREGDGADLARLADVEGSTGLVERAREAPLLKSIAVHALAYTHDFEGLPLLAEVGTSGDLADALAALDSAVELAAAPRRAVDAEDAEELKDGCDRLLALAKDAAAPKERRTPAIRALRMLVDRGCVKRDAIPTELDAK